MNPDKIKHLEFIQAIITRMNSNSFQLKGWAITIVSALLALYASSSNVIYIFIAIIPTILFWFLDAYYLQQERKFRGIYKDVVTGNIIPDFEMPIQNYTGGKYGFSRVFWSKTIAWLYGIIALGLFIGGLILQFANCCKVVHCCH